MKKANGRNESVDILRGISALCVVIGHSIANITSLNILYNFIYSFHMPLFFFLSAYVEEKYSSKYKKNLLILKKRSASLLIPYISWNLIYFFTNNKLSVSSFSSLLSLLSGQQETGLWFLAVMWGLKCLHLAFWYLQEKFSLPFNGTKPLIINISVSFLLELSLIIFAVATRHPFLINMISYALPYFLGIFIANSIEFKAFITKPIVITLSFFGYAIIFPYFSFYNTAWTTQIVRIFLSFCIIIIICNAKSILSFPARIRSIFKCWGQYSLEIYLLHSFFTDYRHSFSYFHSSFLLSAYIVCIAAIVCFLCVFLAQLISISPHIKMLLFGK